MKPMDYVLMAGILVAAGLILIYNLVNFGSPVTETAQVVITVDGVVYGSYPLNEDNTITIGQPSDDQHNTIQILNQRVDMVTADCRDQVCVKTRAITKANQSIVCLPHRVVVEIDNNGLLEESEVDDISR